VDHDDMLAADGFRLLPLTEPTPAALAFLLEVSDDPVSRQWSRSLRSIHDEDSARTWISTRRGEEHSREWLIVDGDGAAVGRAGLHRHGDEDNDIEVGYWTLPSARGRGVARAGARAVARFAHESLGAHRVALVHAVANPASCKVALASSFGHEGTMRAVLDHGDGVKWDMHMHARLAADPWEPLPSPLVPAPPVEVAGDGVLLRPWEQDDAAAVLAVGEDPLISQWNPLGFEDLAAVRRWIDHARTWAENCSWAIVDASSGELLGSVSLHHLSAANARAEAGYWVMPAARGRGVAGRGLAAATAYGFGVLQVERVELYHAAGNVGSCRAADKAGFVLEGTTRRSYRYGDGALHDEHLHARVVGA
jgi:RimJ/RimL family protein N-acetyltransferase